jgi:hypothetical protein
MDGQIEVNIGGKVVMIAEGVLIKIIDFHLHALMNLVLYC